MAEVPVFAAFVAAPEIDERFALPGLGIEQRLKIPTAATGGQLCLVEQICDPGKGPPRHVHKTQTEILRILEGRFELEIDGAPIPAPAGTVAVIPPGRPHAFVNRSDEPGRVLFLLVPGSDLAAFFRRLRELLAEGPVDPERLNRELAAFDFAITGPPMA
ncbi:MAG: cupin domain-containing protein [Geminicoccaceae bacterium]|nr:cupin domain-containing protein [Geminicoccaceae bacterium]